MRRIVALTLTGLGGFLVAFALLMHFYIAPQSIRFPLNELSQTTFTGHDISWFDFKELTELTGVSAKETQSIQGDVEAGSRSTAVWNEFTLVQDVSNNQTITYTTRRSAFNRRTGALVSCCGGYVGTNAAVHQSGQGYVWPIGTQKKTYQVFDPITLRPEPYKYAGTRTILGMPAYEFVERVGNQRFGTQTLQGFLVGANSNLVTVPEYITETNTVWVDPVSGIPLYAIQSQTESLQYAGRTQLVLFQGSLTENRQSAANAVGVAGSFDLRAELLQDDGPLASALLGVVLAVLGMVLTGRAKASRRRALSARSSQQPGPSTAGGPPGRSGGDYPPRLSEGGYAPGLPQPGYAPGLPQAGYAPGLPQPGYAPGLPQAGYAPGWSETGNPRARAGSGYVPGYFGNGHPPERAAGGYPPGYPLPGRMNDGIRRILEPRPDQPRVGRHGRGRRHRA